MSDNFYLFLTSNVPMEKGSQHQNTISNFITHLPEKCFLDDTYECALSDIGYTKHWNNVRTSQKIELVLIGGNEPKNYILNLPPGLYKTKESLITAVMDLIETIDKKDPQNKWIYNAPGICIEKGEQIIKMAFGRTENNYQDGKKLYIHLYFSQQLANMLGFVDEKNEILSSSNWQTFKPIILGKKNPEQDGIVARHLARMDEIHSLYVYSDVLSPRIVGNVYAPLFRQVPVDQSKKQGEDCFHKFDTRYYHPLNHFEFDTIQIVIKDDTNQEIPFRSGPTTLALHFRKRPNIQHMLREILK